MLQLMRALLGCCSSFMFHGHRRLVDDGSATGISFSFRIFKTRFVDQNLTFIFLILKPKYTKNRIGFRISVCTENEKNHWFSLVTGRESHSCSATTTTYSHLSIEVSIEMKIRRI
jgi:hypothetical protein